MKVSVHERTQESKIANYRSSEGGLGLPQNGIDSIAVPQALLVQNAVSQILQIRLTMKEMRRLL
jgi:hypothetical protein